jgi:hypothetical protein
MSRPLLTNTKKVRGELVTSEPPWRTRTFVKRCCFTTSGIGSRASRYEERLERGGDDGCEFQQRFSANSVSLYGEQSTLIVIEQQSLLSELLQQCFDLRILEFDDLLLPLIDHATECSEQNVPWLEQEGHVRRRK